MNTAAENVPMDVEALFGQVADVFASGGTLGSIFNYEEQEYEAVYALGHSLYSQRRYQDAMKAFTFLVMSDPYEKRFVNAYASCMQVLKEYETAIQFYSMTSIMDMTDPAPTFHTGECMIALGRLKEAGEALEIVIQQCKTPEQETMKARAEALMAIINKSHLTSEGASK